MLQPNQLAGARVVVFGGAGFLGGHLLATLAGRGADAVGFDLREPTAPVPDVRYVVGDAREAALVSHTVVGADAVFAFAGGLGAESSIAEPLKDLRSTCEVQLTLLDSVTRHCPDAAVVMPGSRLEYGAPRYLPVDEEHPLSPASPYALHKSACAGYYRLWHAAHGIHTVVLRLSNPYGARRPGEAKQSGFGVLNIFADIALAGGVIRLYGGGGQLRDFVHVSDVVEAAILAASTPEAGGRVFNIGSGEAVSLATAAELVVESCGSGSLDREAQWPATAALVETGDFFFDVGNARLVLGYSPRVDFPHGIAELVEFGREEQGR